MPPAQKKDRLEGVKVTNDDESPDEHVTNDRSSEELPRREENVPLSRLDRAEKDFADALAKANADPDGPRFNKNFFYNAPRGAEMHTRRLDQDDVTHLDWVTAEQLAMDILQRAGVAEAHPELALPLAEALKKVYK